MKKNIYLRSVILFLFFCINQIANAQCPATPANPIVINEVSGDPGQTDASNDGIVELAGLPNTDIGGMVVTSHYSRRNAHAG